MIGDDLSLRLQLIDACRRLESSGLTFGTSGNVSVRRDASSILISPSGVEYATLQPHDIPVLSFDGHWYGRLRPSSEWRFHRDVMRMRTDAGAIVHTHSTYATALACRRQAIPAFHYMVAVAGGRDIRCAPYHTFGTQALSDAVLKALENRSACLLANHGVIAIGRDIDAALKLAGEVENLARQYVIASTNGNVQVLADTEMECVVEKFRDYGRQDVGDADLIHGGESPPLVV
ncbi:MAG: class II aldolase/adducin family protein [Rhodobacteraceae bacterium]|nr:class II aldolase/adducin family protein [Paracoccaceae bacterium]